MEQALQNNEINESEVGEIASHLPMEKPNMLTVELNRHVEPSTPYVPERGLLAGILERAFRDLTTTEKHVRLQAIAWFRASKELDEWSFTFKFVASALELSKREVETLLGAVDRAEKLQALKHQKIN